MTRLRPELETARYFESLAEQFDDYADEHSDFPLKYEANKAHAREYRRKAEEIRKRVVPVEDEED